MVPRPSSQSQGLLRAVLRPQCLSSQFARHSRSRNLHSIPSLGNKDAIFARYGVPGLFSQPTYEETWLQYQTALLNHVNNEVRGTQLEGFDIKTLHERISKQRSKAALYNHAAQAHHNHFFFKGLSAAPEPSGPQDSLRGLIEEWFESFEHLSEEITDTAMSMFGNGYVWLLAENSSAKTMRILCTYNAGSPYPNAHVRQQAAVDSKLANDLTQANNRAGSFGNFDGGLKNWAGGFSGTPILCLKMWEHQYLRDYGLAGKQTYIQNWWKRIDWDEALHRHNGVYDEMAASSGGAMSYVTARMAQLGP